MDAVAHDAVVARIIAGERECYRALVEDLEPEVRGFVAARASALDLVEEVVQGAFVEAYRNLSRYELRGTFAAWVKGFARNLLSRELAARSRLVSTDVEALDALLAGDALSEATDAAADERRRDEIARVERCLQSLAPRARELATRRFARQVPIGLLAQQFKQTRAAIANALTRIRAGLRACVESSGMEQG